jgi:hypothetical protein
VPLSRHRGPVAAIVCHPYKPIGNSLDKLKWGPGDRRRGLDGRQSIIEVC